MKSTGLSVCTTALALALVVALMVLAVPNGACADKYLGLLDCRQHRATATGDPIPDPLRGKPNFWVQGPLEGTTVPIVEDSSYEFKQNGQVCWYRVHNWLDAIWVERQHCFMLWSKEHTLYKIVKSGDGTIQFLPLDSLPVVMIPDKTKADGGKEVVDARQFEVLDTSGQDIRVRVWQTYDKEVLHTKEVKEGTAVFSWGYEKERYRVQTQVVAHRDDLTGAWYFRVGSTMYRYRGCDSPTGMGGIKVCSAG
jgi:hypothetical protein